MSVRSRQMYAGNYVLLTLCGWWITFSCSAQNTNIHSGCGMIKYALKKFDKQRNEYIIDETFWQNPRIWYKDSLAIEEIKGLTIEEDTLGKETRTVGLMHFTFIDIPTRSLYEYTSFSDTARLIRKYTQPDSVIVPGGWTFYAPAKEYPGFDPPEILSDTSINGVAYKRRRIKYANPSSVGQKKQESIAYFRCDKKGKMLFSLLKNFSKEIGCPCVRIDHLPDTAGFFPVLQQVEFVSDELTAEELKVFNAWEKNAKNNPLVR